MNQTKRPPTRTPRATHRFTANIGLHVNGLRALESLRSYLTAHLIDNRRGGEDLVFGRGATKPFTPSTIRNRALAAWGKASLDRICLHECRHSFASMLIEAGGNAKALQEALGHASIQMTWDKYGHMMPGGRDELRERLDSYLSERLSAAASV